MYNCHAKSISKIVNFGKVSMSNIKFVLVPEKDSWKLDGEEMYFNIFWMQKCPDITLEQMFEKKIGFIPKGGDIDALRYPKDYEISVTPRSES